MESVYTQRATRNYSHLSLRTRVALKFVLLALLVSATVVSAFLLGTMHAPWMGRLGAVVALSVLSCCLFDRIAGYLGHP